MQSMNEKYNLVLRRFENTEDSCVKASDFNLNDDKFMSIIEELKYDRLISEGNWCLSNGYHARLTFDGKSFIENNDSKEYHKIEKTEINNSIKIETNHGIAVAGNDNTINASEFNQKFIHLVQEIEKSSIMNKDQILQELKEKKDNKIGLQAYLGTLLTRGAEVATLSSAIGALLSVAG